MDMTSWLLVLLIAVVVVLAASYAHDHLLGGW